MKYCFLFLVSLVPYYSVQHFIWPLHWCLLADICNHTWIPECATDDEDNVYRRRLFIDECDMYEYNCDNVRDYVLINYSDCFNIPATLCPVVTCPSIPPCPDHRNHSPAHLRYARSHFRRHMSTLKMNLPKHMLHGKRRYTPQPRNRRTISRKTLSTTRTIIIKKEVVMRNGRKVMKIVKGFLKRRETRKQSSHDSDFLE